MSAPTTEGFSSEELVTMDCPFTPYVSLYSGSLERLREHFRRCPACCTVSELIAALTRNVGRTDDCPELVELAAWDTEQVGSSAEYNAVALHVRRCGYCQWLIVEGQKAEADQEEVLQFLEAGERFVSGENKET